MMLLLLSTPSFQLNRKEEDIAHPQTGLTPHQIADVRRSWEGIRKDRYLMVSGIFIK